MTKKISEIDYKGISKRVSERMALLKITKVPGIHGNRLSKIKRDATGISTLELTEISRAMYMPIPWIVYGDK